MVYKTPQALDMAIKSAAKSSPMDTGKAISGFFFDRFLCRVFSNPDSHFLLKGGQSILARTIDARMTRDIDLLAEEMSLDTAIEELKRLASTDLSDFITFEFVDARHIKAEDEYRSGLKVTFDVFLGNKKMQPISIDLVVDEIPQGSFNVITPAGRINLPDMRIFDYRTYTVESALSDKLCAIIETHEGRISSRVKDLVDIVVYACTEIIDANALLRRMQIECSARHLPLPSHFEIPHEWHELLESSFHKIACKTKAVKHYQKLNDAEKLAQAVFNPVLVGDTINKRWNPIAKEWE